MPASTRAGLCFLVLLFVPLLPLAATADQPIAGVAVDNQVSLVGSGDVSLGDTGAIHYTGQGPPAGIEFRADRVTLTYETEEGKIVSSPWQEDFQKTETEQDRSRESFSNVTIRVGPFESGAEVLAYPDDGSPDVRGSGTGDLTFDRLDSRFLTQVGTPRSEGSTNNSKNVGFWYTPREGWMVTHRIDQGQVRGDFSLFLNNLTVTVEQDGQTAWKNWTGYSEEETGAGVSSYERRLLQVAVVNGTLSMAEEDGLTLLGSTLVVDADGTVAAETATGQLDLEETAFVFDGEPLRMEGEGRFQVSESSSDSTPGLTLSVADGSGFDVQGGQRVDPGLDASGGIAGWKLWAPLSVLGLAVAGGVAHRSGYASQALESWRSRRYTKWMTRGRELANGGDYSAAAPCFRRATRAQPSKGVAWYHLAIALIEDQRPREVLDVIDEARAGEAVIDELDFLDLEAQAARRVGDLERCRAAVAQLADGSPAMARTLVGELGLSEQVLGHELATRLSWEDDEGDREGLPGYV